MCVQVTSHRCIVGYAPPYILDTLCETDPRFQRVLQRNFYRSLFGAVKTSVPMLK
jgi:hypothetical protein